jgi:hypothetical protein
MPQIIPATPGWYLQECDAPDSAYDAIVAWQEATDDRGEAILLPYVDNGPGYPPVLWTADSLLRMECRIVYQPNRDPGAAS